MNTPQFAQAGPQTLTTLMSCLRDGVLVIGPHNVIEQANTAALRILGLPPTTTLAGKHIGQLQSPSQAVAELFAFLCDGQTSNTALSAIDNENGYTHEDLYSIRSYRADADAGLTRIVVLHDTSSARTQSLEKSNDELDQFAHIVSHDLKAPLRAISNLSLWLEEDLGSSLSGENRDNFVKLRARVVRMESLINGILQYSRVGRDRVPDETLDVFKVVAEAVELLSPPPHISVHISDDLPVMNAPKVMLSQVFSNLLSNAIKYNDKPQGIVKVYPRQNERSFEFVVEDNGPGIPAEYHEKIFVIFQTLQARDKFESTGIGLTIVRRILAAKGGEIRVESAPGEGSKFIFTWPK